MTGTTPQAAAEHLLRELAPRVLGTLARRSRNFAASEDAVQEALLAAAVQWPKEGIPENPTGWLVSVAARRMTDHLRTELASRRREGLIAEASREESTPDADVAAEAQQDDTLPLLFMCCHSSLTRPSAIALTLRAVGGLTTAEIAKAFLVPEATMAQRISRAKQAIKKSGLPFSLPGEGERDERLTAVLHVLYLIFNEGYTSGSGPDLQRVDLSCEAIRLARALHRVLPEDGEVSGLLALMLLTDARRRARTDAAGDLIPLDQQDRTLWDRAAIDEGLAMVTDAIARGAVGPYQVQAAIAAVHDQATRTADTDWSEILGLYGLLEQMSDNPMVALNRAVAAAMVHGPAAGLKLLKLLEADERMASTHRLDAVRAHLFEMAGDHEAALTHYRRAADRTTSIPEQRYLIARAVRLTRARRFFCPQALGDVEDRLAAPTLA